MVLVDALKRTPLRSHMPAFDRTRELRKIAVASLPSGITPADVDALDRLDAAKAEARGSLLNTWIETNTWREVLDEQRMKKKQHVLRSVEKPSNPLEGIYGDTALPAASVLGDVLKNVAGGA
jgi:hypothetical protein